MRDLGWRGDDRIMVMDMTDAYEPLPVEWDGAVNAWKVRHGLWRMGRAEWLTEAGWDALAQDGVRSVVDVRLPQEVTRRETDPPVNVIPDAVERVHLPIEDHENQEFRELCFPYLDHPRYYNDAVRIFPDKVADALTALRERWDAGGVVVHCSAGRDRTGMLTALLLQLDDIPGGPASWEEQAAVYSAAVRGINEHHRTSGIKHPYESYQSPDVLEPTLEDRLDSLKSFLKEWPGDRVAELMASRVLPGAGTRTH